MIFSDLKRKYTGRLQLEGFKESVRKISCIFSDFVRGFLSKSTDAIEAELKEMENAFALITTGAMSGIPAPPSYIGLRLLPYMEREITVMLSRSSSLDDQLAQWFSILEFG